MSTKIPCGWRPTSPRCCTKNQIAAVEHALSALAAVISVLSERTARPCDRDEYVDGGTSAKPVTAWYVHALTEIVRCLWITALNPVVAQVERGVDASLAPARSWHSICSCEPGRGLDLRRPG